MHLWQSYSQNKINCIAREWLPVWLIGQVFVSRCLEPAWVRVPHLPPHFLSFSLINFLLFLKWLAFSFLSCNINYLGLSLWKSFYFIIFRCFSPISVPKSHRLQICIQTHSKKQFQETIFREYNQSREQQLLKQSVTLGKIWTPSI